MLRKIASKLAQSASFFSKTRTPIPLVLDSFKLKRRPFVAVDRDGVKLRLDPGRGDSFTFFEILIRRDYLRDGITLGPGDTVVDVGANLGAFSVMAARVVGPTGRVVAFEPSPDAFDRLSENLALNALANVEAVPEAVGGEAGEAQLYVHGKSAYTSFFDGVDGRQTSHERTVSVTVRTLEQALDARGIGHVDLLKLDCEGAEYGILGSLTPGLARRIKQVAMETHEIPGHSAGELTDRLRDLGFDVHPTYPLVALNRQFHPAERANVP